MPTLSSSSRRGEDGQDLLKSATSGLGSAAAAAEAEAAELEQLRRQQLRVQGELLIA